MQPRLIFRTHYQVDEPALIGLLVTRCTSPTQSIYTEVVSERLAKEIRSKGKEFNIAAARYAADLAQGLQVINAQNQWTAKGQLVNLVFDRQSAAWDEMLQLRPRERLAFFKLFLEADGAALLFIANRLLTDQGLPREREDWNALARSLFLDIYNEYMQLSATPADRVTLRSEIDRIRARGYAGKSGAHKLFVHLQTMHRLGLVDRADIGGSRIYKSSADQKRLLATLIETVPNVVELERVVRDHLWAEVAAQTFASPATKAGEEEILHLVAASYRKVTATGIAICPLSTLIDAAQIELLATSTQASSYSDVLRVLEGIQRQRPADVRFHVDRRGFPAFIKISDQFLDQLSDSPNRRASAS